MYHYYTVLGVARDADDDAVKKAYHRQSLKIHPDKPGGSTEAFQELERARRVLSDSKRRARYDRIGLDLDEKEGDSVGDRVNMAGAGLGDHITMFAARTGVGALLLVVFPRMWWPLRWLQGLVSVGVLAFGAVHRGSREALAARREFGEGLSDAESRQVFAVAAGPRLTAVFVGEWLAHRSRLGLRWRWPSWMYEAGVVILASGGLEGVRSGPAEQRVFLLGRFVVCFAGVRALGQRAWRWLGVVVLQFAVVLAVRELFGIAGAVADEASERTLELYAAKMQEALKSQQRRAADRRRSA